MFSLRVMGEHLLFGAWTGTLLCPDDKILRSAGSSKTVSEGNMKTCSDDVSPEGCERKAKRRQDYLTVHLCSC